MYARTVNAHTPGPWIAVVNDITCNVITPRGALVATCDEDSPDSITAGANARLIAAAPDLLAALMDCINAIQHGGLLEPFGSSTAVAVAAHQRATAAIAKARGES